LGFADVHPHNICCGSFTRKHFDVVSGIFEQHYRPHKWEYSVLNIFAVVVCAPDYSSKVILKRGYVVNL